MLTRKVKNWIILFFRNLQLLRAIDRLRFCYHFMKTLIKNRRFKRLHQDFPTPSFDVAWDAYGRLDWERYLRTGLESAKTYSQIINKYLDETKSNRVLDWGCSAARVIRHMPNLVKGKTEWYGSDFNKQAILWCKHNIFDMTFITNELAPPIAFEDTFFDFIYCISVFTHLSKEMHFAWREELLRLLKDDGVLILSSNGDSHRNTKLLSHEKALYDGGELVVRAGIEEGKKWYSAFHSPRFMREQFFKNLEILEHIPRTGKQDIWVVRKQ